MNCGKGIALADCINIFFEAVVKSKLAFIPVYFRKRFFPDINFFAFKIFITADTMHALTFADKLLLYLVKFFFPGNVIIKQQSPYTCIGKIGSVAVKNFFKNNSGTICRKRKACTNYKRHTVSFKLPLKIRSVGFKIGYV